MNRIKCPKSRYVARKFTLLDAMIITAAVGIGLFVVRDINADWSGVTPTKLGGTINLLSAYTHPINPVMLAVTLSALVISIRRPRPSIRRVLRRPGTIACFGAIAVTLLESVQGILCDWTMSFDDANDNISEFVRNCSFEDLHNTLWGVYWGLPTRIGHTVTVLWLVLIISGRWHPEPNWIDRMGRILGVFWILVGILWWCKNW